jgi:hypothetical protein
MFMFLCTLSYSYSHSLLTLLINGLVGMLGCCYAPCLQWFHKKVRYILNIYKLLYYLLLLLCVFLYVCVHLCSPTHIDLNDLISWYIMEYVYVWCAMFVVFDLLHWQWRYLCFSVQIDILYTLFTFWWCVHLYSLPFDPFCLSDGYVANHTCRSTIYSLHCVAARFWPGKHNN